MKAIITGIFIMISLTGFTQTKEFFSNESIEKLIKSQQLDTYKISCDYDSLFTGSWNSLKHREGWALSSSGAYGFHYLIFNENEKFCDLSGFHSHSGKETASAICGIFHFDTLNGLLYVKWEKCEGTSNIPPFTTLATITTPDVDKKTDEKVYKVIHLTKDELKEDVLVLPHFCAFYKEVLLLVECKKAKWNTPVEKIVKKWNRSKPEEMSVMAFVR